MRRVDCAVRVTLLVGLMALPLPLPRAGGAPRPPQARGMRGVTSGAAARPDFPIRVSPNGHYFVDRDGHPFFYHADTGWELAEKLTDAEAARYLANRKRRGFTAIQTWLLPVTGFVSGVPSGNVDRDGQYPFTDPNHVDFRHPNERYFRHVDAVVAMAARQGLLLVINPCWFGFNGSTWRPYLNAGNALQYGRYLGNRYKGDDNVAWFLGGDNDPAYPGDDKTAALNLLARGIHQYAPRQLISYHADGSSGLHFSSRSVLNAAPWLGFDMVYTYKDVYPTVLADYARARPRRMPVVLGESSYEGDQIDQSDPVRVREQAYQAVLSGAAGDAYGNSVVWHFGEGWENSLGDPKALQMGYLKGLLTARAWYTLVPDRGHTLVTGGYDDADGYVAAARASDGSFALAYVPTAVAPIAVRMDRLRGRVTARWFDPTNGSYGPIGTYPNTGVRRFVPPGPNSAGQTDAVLVLDTPGSSPR